MSAPPSQSPNLPVTENAKKTDLDQSRTNGRRGPSKIIIVILAVVVALLTIGGAWMVVQLSIYSEAQTDWLTAMRRPVTRDFGKALPLASPDPKTPEPTIQPTPGPNSDARAAPTNSAPTPQVQPASPIATPEVRLAAPVATPEVRLAAPVATPEVRRAMPVATPEVRLAMPVATPASSSPQPNVPSLGDSAFISTINKILLEHDWKTLTAFTVDGKVNYFEHTDSTNAYIRDQLTVEATEMRRIRSTVDPQSFKHEVSDEYSQRRSWEGPMLYDSITALNEWETPNGVPIRMVTRLTVGFTMQRGTFQIYALVRKVLQ
jgi:hypothetical protein